MFKLPVSPRSLSVWRKSVRAEIRGESSNLNGKLRALAIFLPRSRGCVSVFAECASTKNPMGSPKWNLWNHSRKWTDRKDAKCDKYKMFYAEAQKLLRGRAWEGVCWQLCVGRQSESVLHKATVEAGAALEPDLLREEAKKVSLWLSQCQIWLGNAGNGDGARLIFSARCQLNKELCGLLARVEVCTDSQPKSVSGHKLNGLNQALIPLFLDCAAHEGQAEPKGVMGHGFVTMQAWPSLFFWKVTIDDRADCTDSRWFLGEFLPPRSPWEALVLIMFQGSPL